MNTVGSDLIIMKAGTWILWGFFILSSLVFIHLNYSVRVYVIQIYEVLL